MRVWETMEIIAITMLEKLGMSWVIDWSHRPYIVGGSLSVSVSVLHVLYCRWGKQQVVGDSSPDMDFR